VGPFGRLIADATAGHFGEQFTNAFIAAHPNYQEELVPSPAPQPAEPSRPVPQAQPVPYATISDNFSKVGDMFRPYMPPAKHSVVVQ
jgi:hypothetical protein